MRNHTTLSGCHASDGLGPSGCAQQMQNDGVEHKNIASDSVFPGGLPPPNRKVLRD
jgi:hypothetical protein